MDIPIIHEDDVMLVLNKPPGVVVNRAQSVKGETVQDWILKKFSSFPASPAGRNSQCSEEDKDFVDRAGIVHRIDKETSGILLVAKTPEAFVELQRQFKEHIVRKTYLAIVHGKLVPGQGEIRAPVGRLPWNRERFGIVPGGRESRTKYNVSSVISHQPSDTSEDRMLKTESFSLVELYPETGRTHQIRVHLKYINHPILGDPLYAGRKTARADRTWAPRVMLHAWKLTCLHPERGTLLAFEAPIPDDMKRIIE